MTRHATDSQTSHACGGTILHGGSGDEGHRYCDRCRAFAYDSSGEQVPSGTDEAANREAWDNGDDCSPDE